MSYLWWTWLLCLINVMVEGLPTFEMTWLEYTIRTDMIIKLKSRPGILLIDWCFNWHIHGTVYSPKQYTDSVIPVIDWLVILFNRLPASYGVVSKCWILLIVPSLLEFVDDHKSLLWRHKWYQWSLHACWHLLMIRDCCCGGKCDINVSLSKLILTGRKDQMIMWMWYLLWLRAAKSKQLWRVSFYAKSSGPRIRVVCPRLRSTRKCWSSTLWS